MLRLFRSSTNVSFVYSGIVPMFVGSEDMESTNLMNLAFDNE